MPRPSSFPPAPIAILAAAALLALAPAATAAAPAPQPHSAVVEFDVAANHGLRAHVATSSEGVALEIKRRRRYAAYEIKGEATEAGLKAKFGKLGEIDVAFVPKETKLEQPPKNCQGPPSVDSTGAFVGTIEFKGERNYVRIDASEAKGTMWVNRESEWRCPITRGRTSAVPRSASPAARVRAKKYEPGYLFAGGTHCHCLFAAFSSRNGRPFFFGAQFEKREKMEITRVTGTGGGPSSFLYDHHAGTAKVDPPGPFTGTGVFKRTVHGPDLWRSTLRVPLLGVGTIHFGGPDFGASLTKEFSDE